MDTSVLTMDGAQQQQQQQREDERKEAAAWEHYGQARPRGKRGPTGREGKFQRRTKFHGKGGDGEGGGGGGGHDWEGGHDHDAAATAPGGAAGGQQRPGGASAPRRENATLEAYYRAMRVVPEGAEWDAFWGCLRSPLPVCVRVNRSMPGWQAVVAQLSELEGFTALEWYPHRLAWQCESPEFNSNKALKQTVDRLNQAGVLAYQEAVSMLPPLLLGMEPHHLVMDTCAAPGSKTLQALDLLHFGEFEFGGSAAEDEDEDKDAVVARLAQGAVLANDIDVRFIPSVRTRKMASPAALHTIANAAKFPPQFDPDAAPEPFADHLPSAGASQVLYDRIVCDVPCSGDGTLRKNPSIWAGWKQPYALKLHTKQLRILLRALHHLAPGGRLTYSTCSMNPVENEAVVLAALARLPDVHLVEAPPNLLPTTPALTTWQVAYPARPEKDRPTPQFPKLEFFDKWEDVPPGLRPDNKGLLRDTMFPTPVTRGNPIDAAPRSGLNASLRKCIRVLPHKSNTGGFFVAIFTKTAHKNATTAEARAAIRSAHTTEAMAAEDNDNDDDNDGDTAEAILQVGSPLMVKVAAGAAGTGDASTLEAEGAPAEEGGAGGAAPPKEKALPHFARQYSAVDASTSEWRELCATFGLNELKLPMEHLLWEKGNLGKALGMAAVSRGVMRLLGAKPGLTNIKQGTFIHSAGIHIFEPMQANFLMCCPCRWRPAQEGANFLSRYMSKQVVCLPMETLQTLLDTRMLPRESLPGTHEVEVGGAIAGLALPDCITLTAEDNSLVKQITENMWVACVLTGKGLQSFTDKHELQALSIRLGIVRARLKATTV